MPSASLRFSLPQRASVANGRLASEAGQGGRILFYLQYPPNPPQSPPPTANPSPSLCPPVPPSLSSNAHAVPGPALTARSASREQPSPTADGGWHGRVFAAMPSTADTGVGRYIFGTGRYTVGSVCSRSTRPRRSPAATFLAPAATFVTLAAAFIPRPDPSSRRPPSGSRRCWRR
jgi:hypothetical protein